LREAIAAFRFGDDGTCEVYGRRFALTKAADADALPRLTAETLASELYGALHCRMHAVGVAVRSADQSRGALQAFEHRLSRANTGTGPWEAGWRYVGAAGSRHVVVRGHGANFIAAAAGVRPPHGSATSAFVPGALLDVRIPNEQRNLMHGYYMVLGNADHPPEATDTVRVYWNVSPEGAAPLIAELTGRLNDAGIPFRFKTPNAVYRFRRCDTGVLYMPLDAYRDSVAHIARAHCATRHMLRGPMSPLLADLGPGIAAAYDTDDGGSFGVHRTQLIAAALFSVLRLRGRRTPRGLPAAAATLRAVDSWLRKQGYDPARLYLQPGRRDIFTPLVPPRGGW
jgi:hypothetical protein